MKLKNSAHNETVVKFASSKDEVKRAFELAKDIFIKDPNSQSSTFKELSWNIKANNIFKNIIIATSGSDIIGVVRLCPRTFLWQRKKFKVAGISSVCVHPKFRKMGVARSLMQTTINHCDQQGYELTFLVARRAIDHFYKKFGFFGASSYPKILIAKKPDLLSHSLSFSDFKISNFQLYRSFYEYSYQLNFGVTHRTKFLWRQIQRLIEAKDIEFREILINNKLAGYVVSKQHLIIEIAFNRVFEREAVEQILAQWPNDQNGYVEVRASHQHTITHFLWEYDTTFVSRRCIFGGHMIRWKKPESLIKMDIAIGKLCAGQNSNLPFFSLNHLDEV